MKPELSAMPAKDTRALLRESEIRPRYGITADDGGGSMAEHEASVLLKGNLDDLVDDGLLAQWTTTSRAYWRKLRSERRGPKFYRCGRLIRYKLADVLAWFEGHAVDPVNRPKL